MYCSLSLSLKNSDVSPCQNGPNTSLLWPSFSPFTVAHLSHVNIVQCTNNFLFFPSPESLSSTMSRYSISRILLETGNRSTRPFCALGSMCTILLYQSTHANLKIVTKLKELLRYIPALTKKKRLRKSLLRSAHEPTVKPATKLKICKATKFPIAASVGKPPEDRITPVGESERRSILLRENKRTKSERRSKRICSLMVTNTSIALDILGSAFYRNKFDILGSTFYRNKFSKI